MRQHLKRGLAVLFGLVCATALFCGSAFAADEVESGTCGENLTWVLDSEGTLTISGSGRMRSYYLDDSPWNRQSIQTVIMESGVTSIADSAFSGCTNLTNTTIPDSVTSIGYSAFYGCTSLTSITIPDNVTSIYDNAFSGCTSLTSVTIPDSVTSIGGGAFSGCSSLTSITIPDSVTSIGNGAFSGCTSLTSINIPDSVTSIYDYAFQDCSKLTSITFPAGLYCPDSAFENTPILAVGTCGKNLTWVLDSEGTLTISGTGEMWDFHYGSIVDHVWVRHLHSIQTVILESGVTSIGNGAFGDCSNLTSITIPDSVTSIGNGAFFGCSSLTSIIIPNGVTSIGDHAFNGCSNLTSIIIPNGVTSIGDHAFNGCSNLTSVTIPDSVTSIGDRAFSGCTNLTSITIPNGVTSIGEFAFYGCSSLTSITIPNGVTSIGSCAFYSCSKLPSITIPNSVTSIGTNTFSGCESLTSVTISDNATSIDERAFYGCSSLTSVNIPGKVESIDDKAFASCAKLKTIRFLGDAPFLTGNVFYHVTATAYYPAGNQTWTDNMLQNYGGHLAWQHYGDLSDLTVTRLSACTVTLSATTYTYNGSAKKPAVTVKDGNTTLKAGTDYTLSNPGGTTPGTYTVTVTGKGSYTGTLLKTFTIRPKPLTAAMVTLSATSYTYNGSPKKPAITVKNGTTVLKSGTDYTVDFINNTNAGIAYAILTGIGNYTGTVTKQFTIKPKPLITAMATLSITSYTYNGSAKKPAVNVKNGTAVLKSGADYTVDYINNTNAGTAYAIITGIGNYSGTVSKTFTIKAKAITPTVTLSKTAFVYNGQVQKPTVTVKDGTTSLTTANYTVTWPSGCKVVGVYKPTVTLKGNYSGSKAVSYKINPKGTTMSKITAVSKGFTATWNKQATQTTGYQIQYSLSSTFASGNKTALITPNTTLSKKVTGLTAKKKYYVRVRTYKTVNDVKYYSSWSTALAVTTKV